MNHQPRRIFNEPSTGEAKENNWEEVWWSASGNCFTERRRARRKAGRWRWVRTGSGSRRWIRARSGSEGWWWGWRNHLPAPIGGKIFFYIFCAIIHIVILVFSLIQFIQIGMMPNSRWAKPTLARTLTRRSRRTRRKQLESCCNSSTAASVDINFCQTIYFETLSSDRGRGHHKH